ncbi:josephin-1 isoform X1 [Balaenoptera musculus]|uniref:Josephin-1 isoform X1 n=1 Tax=Balaenoptera musculus TaxID=9771 RepID=A0A8B8YLG3_BALMU|nr:josephin-1 isoform X1 [Balaenoptera musculus]
MGHRPGTEPTPGGGEGRDRHRGGTPAGRPACPAPEGESRGSGHQPRSQALALPAARRRSSRRRATHPTPPGGPTQPAPVKQTHGSCRPKAGAADVRPTSEGTPRRGGSWDGEGGRFRSTRRAGAADVGLRCARSLARPSAAQVAARSSRWRPAAGRGKRVRVRAFRGSCAGLGPAGSHRTREDGETPPTPQQGPRSHAGRPSLAARNLRFIHHLGLVS